MKVLHLDSGVDWRGGQQQICHLVPGLERLGVEQHLVLKAGGRLASLIEKTNLMFSSLPYSSEWDFVSLYHLYRITQRFRPDIIHAHDSRTLGLAVLLKAFGERARVIAARRVAFSIRKNPLRKIKYQESTDRIIAVSFHIRDRLVKDGIDPRKIQVVYDGFDWRSLRIPIGSDEARSALNVRPEDLLIGTAGQFTPEKGHEVLIRGFKAVYERYSSARLLVVGEGRLRSNYERLIHQLKLDDRVILPGFVPDLRRVLPALDLFVFPSLEEGLGSTLLMSMAHRIPVCASRSGGIPELVVEDETGFLFPPGNVQALAQTVIRALEDSEKRQCLARNAFSRVRTDFPVERMITETYQIYTNVLNSRIR